MKTSIKTRSLSLLLLLSLTSACTLGRPNFIKHVQNNRITVTPEKIVNINGRLEFSCELTYRTKHIQKYDSLEYRFYLTNPQIETYVGSIKDADLKNAPYKRTFNKEFKVVWYSKGQDSAIAMEVVYYKKGRSKVSPKLNIGTVYSKP